MFPGPSRHPGVGPSPVSVNLISLFTNPVQFRILRKMCTFIKEETKGIYFLYFFFVTTSRHKGNVVQDLRGSSLAINYQ